MAMGRGTCDRGAAQLVWILLVVLLLMLLVAVALLWRSMWWTESGAEIPRGTHLLQREMPHPIAGDTRA